MTENTRGFVQLVPLVRRWWWLLVVALVLSSGASYYVTKHTKNIYGGFRQTLHQSSLHYRVDWVEQ